MRLRSRAALSAALTGIATLLLSTSASAAPEPGAPGIGDPYYPNAGNGGYDVEHYDVRLTYQPGADKLAGTTTILATSTQELSSFNLDFALRTKSVRVNNAPAKFRAEGDSELKITPAQPLPEGRPMTVVVNYADVPSKVQVDGFTAWKKTADGALAVDEPAIAAWWYPSNDHPLDKATFDVSAEVPDSVSALSNGILLDKEKRREGWTRWNWRSRHPQTTYLTMLTVGDFEVREEQTPSGQPFVTAYSKLLEPGAARAAKASVQRTPEVTEVLAEDFGAYPFEAQGGVVHPELGFALENQTRPVYDDKYFARGSTNTYVVAHEVAHQWFGDSVAVGGWRNIWLNEGFASYAEYLWSEYLGEGTAPELAQYIYDSTPPEDELWQVAPGDPGPDNQFHPAVYDRGALAVQAVRTEVGDAAFFEILRAWLDERAGGTGTIEDFRALAERISGKSLDALLRTWLFTKGKPATGPNGEASALAGQRMPESLPKIAATHRQLHSHGS